MSGTILAKNRYENVFVTDFLESMLSIMRLQEGSFRSKQQSWRWPQFVDVGGHVGTWSLALANLMDMIQPNSNQISQHGGPVISIFEPLQFNVNILKKSIGTFGNHNDNDLKRSFAKYINLYGNIAIGDSNSESDSSQSKQSYYIAPDDQKDNKTFSFANGKLQPFEPGQSQSQSRLQQQPQDQAVPLPVPVLSLDEIYHHQLTKKTESSQCISTVKIDVEGHELAVLKGGKRLFGIEELQSEMYDSEFESESDSLNMTSNQHCPPSPCLIYLELHTNHTHIPYKHFRSKTRRYVRIDRSQPPGKLLQLDLFVFKQERDDPISYLTQSEKYDCVNIEAHSKKINYAVMASNLKHQVKGSDGTSDVTVTSKLYDFNPNPSPEQLRSFLWKDLMKARKSTSNTTDIFKSRFFHRFFIEDSDRLIPQMTCDNPKNCTEDVYESFLRRDTFVGPDRSRVTRLVDQTQSLYPRPIGGIWKCHNVAQCGGRQKLLIDGTLKKYKLELMEI